MLILKGGGGSLSIELVLYDICNDFNPQPVAQEEEAEIQAAISSKLTLSLEVRLYFFS